MTTSRAEKQRRADEALAITVFMSTTAVRHKGNRQIMTSWHRAFSTSGLLNHTISVSRFSRVVAALGYPRVRTINGTAIDGFRIGRNN